MKREIVYYELYDKDQYIGEYRCSEIMKMLGIRHHQLITYYAESGAAYQGRYLMKKVEKPLRKGWGAEWESIRLRILWDGIRLRILMEEWEREKQRLNWLWKYRQDGGRRNIRGS